MLVDLADDVHRQVILLARAWNVSEGEVVHRLLDAFTKRDHADTTTEDAAESVAIYADYEGHRIEAAFYPATRRVDIGTGPLAGRSFRSPSGAAIGVVQALNPNVQPNRNGWSFWFLSGNGKALQSIRGSSRT